MKRVRITFGFVAAVCFFAWLDGAVCLWFLLSLLVHELGHLLMMRLWGVPVNGIRLQAAGAVISGVFGGYGQEVCCAAAGPACSFLLTLLTLRSVPELSIVSAVLGVVNLLPIYPLDGGRILRGCLMLWTEGETAEKILRSVTAGVCCGLMAGACWAAVCLQAGIWPIFAVLVVLWRVGTVSWKDQ